MRTLALATVLLLSGCALTPEQAEAMRRFSADLKETAGYYERNQPVEMNCTPQGPMGRVICTRY